MPILDRAAVVVDVDVFTFCVLAAMLDVGVETIAGEICESVKRSHSRSSFQAEL